MHTDGLLGGAILESYELFAAEIGHGDCIAVDDLGVTLVLGQLLHSLERLRRKRGDGLLHVAQVLIGWSFRADLEQNIRKDTANNVQSVQYGFRTQSVAHISIKARPTR